MLRLSAAAMGAALSQVALVPSAAAQPADLPPALSPKEFRALPIRKIETLSHDTKRIELALPSAQQAMGMDVASFVLVKGPNDAGGKMVTKPYTPTNTNADKGFCELVVKAYPGGQVTSFLHSLKVGDLVEVKGPMTKFKYTANMKKHITMVAGGSGITPMLQVLHEIVAHPEDRTEVHLVFANRTEEDILLRSQIDAIARRHPRVKVTYVLSRPSAAWTGARGHVDAALLRAALPAPGADSLVLVCGPPGFMATVSGNKTPDYKQGLVEGLLRDFGFNESMVFKF